MCIPLVPAIIANILGVPDGICYVLAFLGLLLYILAGIAYAAHESKKHNRKKWQMEEATSAEVASSFSYFVSCFPTSLLLFW